MKILEETKSLMVLQETNILYGYLIISLIVNIYFFYIISVWFTAETILLTILFVAISLFLILISKKVSITIDKNKNTLEYFVYRVIGKKKIKYTLSQIKEIKFESYITSATGTSIPYPVYRLKFIFHNKEEKPLVVSGSGVVLGSKCSVELALAEKISKFLNVPLNYQP